MAVSDRELKQFIERERAQGRHLRQALLARRYEPRLFRMPQAEVGNLGQVVGRSLFAPNPEARVRWLRTFASTVCKHLRAKAPGRRPKKPVYMLTLISDRGLQSERSAPSPRELRHEYQRHLLGLNYAGMIEPALYVRLPHGEHYPRGVLWHMHALVWGISEEDLEERCRRLRRSYRTLIPRATPAQYDLVRPGDLLQVIWYINKAPRTQYEITKARDSLVGRLRQYTHPMNGVNSVRLYKHMSDLYLHNLAVSGGDGKALMKQIKGEALKEWRRAERDPNPIRLGRSKDVDYPALHPWSRYNTGLSDRTLTPGLL